MDETLYTTDEMLAKALRSDTRVLGEIIGRYETKLSRYIQRKSNASFEDRKDILQNIFIKIYKNINDFDPDLSFSSWTYRIARNEMIDWYRREKRRPHLSLEGDEGVIQTLASELGADIAAQKAELRQTIEGAVQTLPEKYQDIVELRFFEEKSYDEIADILALPPGTVAVRINRVKTMLQEALEKHYGQQH